MSDSLRTRATAVALVLLVLAGAAVTAAYLRLRTSVPGRSGEATLRGLRDTAVVRFDSFAVPHVSTVSEEDLLFAQGWLHARDRLWQMELLRRTAQGRLSELFGGPALETDRLLRTLDLWGAAGRSVGALDPGERRSLRAYARGVNAFLEEREGALPPEFVLLGVEPEPWTPRASAAVGKVMALDLSPWRRELSRFHARRTLPPEKRALLEPAYPSWAPTILPAYRPARPGAPSMTAGEGGGAGPAVSPASPPAATPSGPAAPGAGGGDRDARGAGAGPRTASPDPAAAGPAPGRRDGWDPMAFLSGSGLSASNNLALGPSRTRSGGPLVANDMHLGLRAPAVWYVMGLRAEEGLTAAGLTLPGAPGVVVGFTPGVAWSFTNAMVDDVDFAVETVNLDGSAYRTADGWRDFAVRPETIRVRGREEPMVHRVRETVRGPVLSDVLPDLGATLSAAWTGARPTTEVRGLLAMNRARDAEAFARAVEAFDLPQQNVVYATAAGALGYRLSGRVPRRDGYRGSLPVSARAMGRGWTGMWPPASHPAALARPLGAPGGEADTSAAGEAGGRGPPADATGGGGAAARSLLTGDGFLASANNLQAPGLFGVVGVDYPLPFRARRIVDLLSGGERWGPEDVVELQRDTRSLLADRLADRARAAARRAGREEVARLLSDWDHRVDRGSRAAGVFYAWAYRIRSLVAADEFRTTSEWGYFPMSALLRVLAGAPGSRAWIDDVTTDSAESLEGLEERALRDAAGATGLRPWGELHRERHGHPLGRVGWLDRLFGFDVGPYPSPGAPRTVRPDDYMRWRPLDERSWRPPWINDYGPSERLVVSLGPGGPEGWFLLPTGQSGNPLDPHYRDMSGRWREGGAMIRLPMDPEEVAARSTRSLTLAPGDPARGGGGDR